MTVERSVLGNGLTVLVERQPAASRVAVCVHHRVGFRSEPPGREGFAHLFEHLMFRGSQSLPEGAFYEHLLGVGGHANGTTHQDYTDYYQVLPPAALEQALFADADRLRAPVFGRATLTQQLAGVAEEIRAATRDRRYGGFPWPLLSPVLFRRHANAHDGYGSPAALARVTPDDCAEFFDRHYPPGGAVLTVVGDVDPDTVRILVERHFGPIPPRPVPVPTDITEDPPTGIRRHRSPDPSAPSPAVAVGYRLPDPAAALADHLAAQVVAALLAVPPLDASCGFFGPLDARDPDPLVLATRLPVGGDPDHLLAALTARLAAVAGGTSAPAVDAAAGAVLGAHLTVQADLTGRGRSLGRSEALFGDAGRVDAVPGLLAALDPAAVGRAAVALSRQHPAVLVVEPGPRRRSSPPALRVVPAGAGGRTAAELAGAPGGPLPRPGPLTTTRRRRPDVVELPATGGVRLVVARDDRSPLVELVARIPYPAPGLLAAELAADRAAAAVGAHGRAASCGGTFAGDWDGFRLQVTGRVPAAGLPVWLALLGDWFAALGSAPAVPVPRRTPDLWRVAADVLRRRVLPPAGATGGGGCLAVVGPVGPRQVSAGLDRALRRLPPAGPPEQRAPAAGGGTAVVPVPGADRVLVSVSTVNPSFHPGRPDWFLAVTAFGGHPGSRLVSRSAARGPRSYEVEVGYDRALGRPRTYIRATARPELVEDVLADVAAELGRLAGEPLRPAEVRAAADHAAAAALAPFDSPAGLAEALCSIVSDGAPADWLARAPAELPGTGADRVAAAGARLFPIAPVTVVVGDVDRVAEASDRNSGGLVWPSPT